MTCVIEDAPLEVGHLPAIGLEELISIADLQTRRERKYLLTLETVRNLLDGVGASALDIGDLRSFRYESIYFDTRAWDSYLGAARRRPRRFKVRTRRYVDSDECVLEVKVRSARGDTVKHRFPYESGIRDLLTVQGLAFVESVEAAAPFARCLEPVLNVSYRRSTLALQADRARVTIDQNATWWTGSPFVIRLGGLALVETKTPGPPCEIDRALWRAGHRPITISKYCTGLAALERELPSNKWSRVLRHTLIPHIESMA